MAEIRSLAELYQTYAENVFDYLLHLSGDRALADELTGETFYRAMLSLDGFRGDASVKTWLLRIARNLYLRQRQRAQRSTSLEALQEQGMIFCEKQSGPETTVLRHEQHRALRHALHQLSEQDRTLLLLVTQEEMAQREIAHILGISVSAVKVRLFRARQRLAALFIGRLQQTVFLVSIGVLMLFTFGWAAWHRFVLLEVLSAEGIYLQLPIRFVLRVTGTQIWLTVVSILLVVGWQWWQRRHPQTVPAWYQQAKVGLYALLGLFAYNLTGTGEMPGILIGGAFLLALYIMLLRWRMRQPWAEALVEWGRSGITAVPLLGLILATINTITTGHLPGIFIAPGLLVIGLAYTYRHLPRLPYLPSIAVVSLLLANSLLALRAIQAFMALLVN